MNIIESTQRYENWLRKQIPVVESDLQYKHEQMRVDPFLFFRATFYRWSQLWWEEFPELARAEEVRAVGDLHLENFGTWRDTEGRLVWGVNDFDEAHPMAFTNDLVRLATSTLLSLHIQPKLKLKRNDIFHRILEGYEEALAQGGEPVILMERHPKLGAMARQHLRQPAEFWPRLEAKSSSYKEKLPDGLVRAFKSMLPKGTQVDYRIVTKPKGLGSLGRRRFLVLVQWQGGKIAREAKDVVPSAYGWALKEKDGRGNPWLEKTVESAVRCHDAFYQVKGRWLVRRLAPDCSRIDFDELKNHSDLATLLNSMGWETANIHLGTSKAAKKLGKALKAMPEHWLKHAAETMFKLCLKDWQDFCEAGK